jgi:hypothetical protein
VDGLAQPVGLGALDRRRGAARAGAGGREGRWRRSRRRAWPRRGRDRPSCSPAGPAPTTRCRGHRWPLSDPPAAAVRISCVCAGRELAHLAVDLGVRLRGRSR